MHLILKCVVEHEIQYLDNLQYLTCEINDIVICDSYFIKKDEILGFGKNYKTNSYGLFQINKFVLVDKTNYVNNSLLSIVLKNQADVTTNDKSKPGISHRVSKKSVGKASICYVCGEYLIGLRLEYIHCTVCNQIFHNLCYQNHKTLTNCHRFLKLTNQDCSSSMSSSDVAITDWTNEQVLQWLCSINFFRLIDLFELKNITGKELLESFPADENEIINLSNSNRKFWTLITDVFYRESLYLALATLMGEIKSSGGENRTREIETVPETGVQNLRDSKQVLVDKFLIELGNHKFRETSYTCKTYCYYCNGVLLGLQKQGLHCVKCLNNFHKMCSFQSNIPLCSVECESSEPNSLNSSVFGVSLEEQLTDENDVPVFIKSCISELERRFSMRNCGNKLLDTYSQTADTKETEKLKELFAQPNYDGDFKIIGLSDITDVLLAKLIKLYFKELPEPVLTYGLYHSLTETVRPENSDEISCAQMHSLLVHLPRPNRRTLRYLLIHFEIICSKILDDSNKWKNAAKKWSCIFSKTLIWPSHLMVKEFPNRKSRHQRIIQLLFEHKLLFIEKFVWSAALNGPMSENIDSMTLSQSLNKAQFQSLQSSLEDINGDLISQDWYWSDTTKEEVNEYMSGLQDGYFMVRDSSDKTLGSYTLTIRKDGENKLIRIMCQNGCYGFREPYPFESVPQLIKYYQVHKLSEYNDQLNLTLRYPYSKTKSDSQSNSNDFIQYDNCKLIDLLHQSMTEYSLINQRIDKDTEAYENIQKELDEVTKCLKGIDRIQTWCTNHMEHIMNTISTNKDSIRDHSRKCLAQLCAKLKHCDEVIKEMNERRDKLTASATFLHDQLSNNRPALKKSNRLQSQCIRLLKDRGVPDQLINSDTVDNIDKFCEDIRSALNENNPINNKSNWFIEDITREEATSKLIGKPHGTFLIRKSKGTNTYALDIMVANNIQHCRILYMGGKYGFIENECLYYSLEDLVKTFHMRSLKHYNSNLTTNLAYPVNL